MRPVLLFFLLMSMLASLWIVATAGVRATVLSTVKRFLPAVLFAAAITIALLAIAFITNGKII